MSDLIRQLPERGLETALRDISSLNSELKSAQRLSSLGGQVSYTLQTANTWDLTETLPTVSDLTIITLRVTLVYDGSQAIPFEQLYLDVRANGTGESNRFVYLNGTYAGVIVVGLQGWTDNTNLIVNTQTTTTFQLSTITRIWNVDFQYKGSVTYYAKASVQASSNGTLTVARVA